MKTINILPGAGALLSLSGLVLTEMAMPTYAADSPTTNLQRCLDPDEFDPSVDYFPDKFVPHETTDLFTVSYHNSFKILTNNFNEKTYVLYQCGSPPPTAEEIEAAAGGGAAATADLVLPCPHMGGVAITETPQIPPVEGLGMRREILAYIGNPKYVSSPCLDYMMDTRDTLVIFDPADPYNGTKTKLATKAWLESNPDAVIFGGPYYGLEDGGNDVRGTDRVINIAASQERTNEATFDWLGLYGALFNLEAMATRITTETEARYDCASWNAEVLSADLKENGHRRPTVFWANFIEGYGWSVAECPTWDSAYYCEYAKHCGADILARPDGVGYNMSFGGDTLYWYLSDEEVLDLGKDADYFIYPSITWEATYADKRDLLDQFKSVRNRMVYDSQGKGPFAWHEQRLAEYDVVGLDFCHIVGLSNPNPPLHVLRWFRNVFTDAIGSLEPCDVPDEVGMPYVPKEAACTPLSGPAPAPEPEPSTSLAAMAFSSPSAAALAALLAVLL